MLQFEKDYRKNFTVEQLVAKYHINKAKVARRIELINEVEVQRMPEPPHMTYEELNSKLKKKFKRKEQQPKKKSKNQQS